MIEYPNLEIRPEDRLVAEAIARVSGGLTSDLVEAQIRARRELLLMIDAGLESPICPELTNANPSAPHTVLLEAFGWLLAQQAYRINRVPEQNLIAFANLFGIEPRAATAAETILEFSVDPPADTDVTIPAETQVSSSDGLFVFETAESIVIPFGTATGEVLARRTTTGQTLLAPNTITEFIDTVAFVETVTNPSAVDSGTGIETLESTLNRVKFYQRRGERIVSTKDLEDAILTDALAGNGVVRAFPFIINGEFLTNKPTPGHTTVIVMTRTGDNIDSGSMNKVAALLDQAVGNQFIYVVNPFFVEFNVEASVKLNTGSPQGAVLAAVERNLRNFYSPSREKFGRPILRSEIIAVIEGTAGIDRIEVIVAPGETLTQNTPILAAPIDDAKLLEFQLPKLVTVTINAV